MWVRRERTDRGRGILELLQIAYNRSTEQINDDIFKKVCFEQKYLSFLAEMKNR